MFFYISNHKILNWFTTRSRGIFYVRFDQKDWKKIAFEVNRDILISCKTRATIFDSSLYEIFALSKLGGFYHHKEDLVRSLPIYQILDALDIFGIFKKTLAIEKSQIIAYTSFFLNLFLFLWIQFIGNFSILMVGKGCYFFLN